MPVMNVLTNLAANGTAAVLQGQQYEFPNFDAFAEFAIVADGANVDVFVAAGPDILQQSGPAQQKAANTPPVYPDDFILSDYIAAGDRLNVTVRETGGLARVVRTQVRLTPQS